MPVFAPPKTAVIATALCNDCTFQVHLDAALCHQRAQAHMVVLRHRVLVVETTTTSYEATP